MVPRRWATAALNAVLDKLLKPQSFLSRSRTAALGADFPPALVARPEAYAGRVQNLQQQLCSDEWLRASPRRCSDLMGSRWRCAC